MSKAAQRKNEHLSIFEKYYNPKATNDFDEIRLIPNLLPELSLSEIDPRIDFLNHHFPHSFFINAMTGGTARAQEINAQLASVANKFHLAMAVGSQKIALAEPELRQTFSVVRQANPDGFIIANLNANQNVQQVKEAIAMIDANAVQLHLNSLQELINSTGDRNFHLLANIDKIINSIEKPVILKSVGFGLSPHDLRSLQDIGVKYVDVSGTGGTNFIQIENQQNKTHQLAYLSELGLSTVETLRVAQNFPFETIASGGIRNPLDVVKSHVLGAKMVGVSGTFLHPLIKKEPQELELLIEQWIEVLPKIMLMLGKKSIADLAKAKYIPSIKLTNAGDFLDKSF
ncbi:type 2 isopentenyl-diphosphate Delta-isomerase [Xylocopilactobacillus apicola]|uniref:Isopentenyl-diphosphate delta-isomerase n=1 Tax=Xylocopilactobacillus apicola TaxID=2932184 RepID=A0AAU9DA43_9LACO|nr:type 2 isopentenyl-diphosphate Delta-isomerase [Xylocopilactobacillus apicola]BDR58375.1 isopentenyl-diphosphate delta-isomerase [Xylocopilactobacillus apicola]